jgi:hypothetical protein
MFSLPRRKSLVLLISISGFIALVLLAEAMADVSFRPAMRFREEDAAPIQFAVAKAIDQFVEVPFWQHLLVWMTVFLIVVIISSILSEDLRKRIIKAFFKTAVIVLSLLFILKNYRFTLPALAGNGLRQLGDQDLNADLPAPPDFQAPQVSPWLAYVVSLGVALLLIALFVFMNRWWKRKQELLALERPLDEIGLIARDSLDELYAGKSWDDVIVDCYVRMSRVVAVRRGVLRQESMTPGEFAERLEMTGIPSNAVRRLTSLFESVRYGAGKSSRQEIDEAMNCLKSILNYCGETA